VGYRQYDPSLVCDNQGSIQWGASNTYLTTRSSDAVAGGVLMKIVVTGRRGGKTIALVQVLKENPNAVMLVHSLQAAIQVCHDHGVSMDRVMPWSQAEILLRGSSDTDLLIDNVDMLIREFIHVPHPIHMITMTGEPIVLAALEMLLPEGF
jgi:hypothetical protein